MKRLLVTIGQKDKNLYIILDGMGMIDHHYNDEGSFDASSSRQKIRKCFYKGKKIAKGDNARVLHFSSYRLLFKIQIHKDMYVAYQFHIFGDNKKECFVPLNHEISIF